MAQDMGPDAWFIDAAIDPTEPGRLFLATPQGLYVRDAHRGPTTVVQERGERLPAGQELWPNHPNPFSAETLVRYQLSAGRPR